MATPKTEDQVLQEMTNKVGSFIKDAIWAKNYHAEEKQKKLESLKSETLNRLDTLLKNAEFDFNKQNEIGVSGKSVYLEGGVDGIKRAIEIIKDCELNGIKWL